LHWSKFLQNGNLLPDNIAGLLQIASGMDVLQQLGIIHGSFPPSVVLRGIYCLIAHSSWSGFAVSFLR
jgi:hypothetical protein